MNSQVPPPPPLKAGKKNFSFSEALMQLASVYSVTLRRHPVSQPSEALLLCDKPHGDGVTPSKDKR